MGKVKLSDISGSVELSTDEIVKGIIDWVSVESPSAVEPRVRAWMKLYVRPV